MDRVNTTPVVAVVAAGALALTGCTNSPPLTSQRDPSLTKITVAPPTSESTPEETPEAPETLGPAPGHPKCVSLPAATVKRAEVVGNAGGVIRYLYGKRVRAGRGWWFVAVKAHVSDPVYQHANGVDKNGMVSFVTNAPTGDTWFPLYEKSGWDGVTPSGVSIPDWPDYRRAALACLGG